MNMLDVEEKKPERGRDGSDGGRVKVRPGGGAQSRWTDGVTGSERPSVREKRRTKIGG